MFYPILFFLSKNKNKNERKNQSNPDHLPIPLPTHMNTNCNWRNYQMSGIHDAYLYIFFFAMSFAMSFEWKKFFFFFFSKFARQSERSLYGYLLGTNTPTIPSSEEPWFDSPQPVRQSMPLTSCYVSSCTSPGKKKEIYQVLSLPDGDNYQAYAQALMLGFFALSMNGYPVQGTMTRPKDRKKKRNKATR